MYHTAYSFLKSQADVSEKIQTGILACILKSIFIPVILKF